MDDTTRLVIAYAILLLGIPLMAAKIIWAIPGTVTGIVFEQIIGGLRKVTTAVAEGFLSLLLTCLVFEYLNIPVVIAVPAVLIILHIIWYEFVSQTEMNSLPSVAGIVIGFLVYPKVLTFLPVHLLPMV